MNNLDRWAQFNYFIDNMSPQLTGIARDVWLAIFRHANANGASFATRGRIAGILNVSTTHVDTGIRLLKQMKLITKIEGNNGYILSLPEQDTQPELSPTQPELSPPMTTILITPDNHSYHPTQPELSPLITPVITPDNQSYHITEPSYRTSLHNPLTEPTQKAKPKQAKLPKTSKSDWKAKASTTFLFEAMKLYPAHRRTYKPKEFQAIWDDAANEEGGHDVLWNMVREHLEQAVTSTDWTKECGKYVPSMENYIGKRKYRAPVVGATEYGEEFDVGF